MSPEPKPYEKKLKPFALKIADDAMIAINRAILTVDTPDMPYKAQYVLEEVVAILESHI